MVFQGDVDEDRIGQPEEALVEDGDVFLDRALFLTRDLEGRLLRVTVDGISWESARLPDVPTERYLEFYYHMALTRAVDGEIVKLSRKGLAFGKHLMCTGNEASAVGATHALAQEDWITLCIR